MAATSQLEITRTRARRPVVGALAKPGTVVGALAMRGTVVGTVAEPRTVVAHHTGVLDPVAPETFGVAYTVRTSTMRDRAALNELRASAEAIGSANSYFGAPGHAVPSGRATRRGWPVGGTTVVAESEESVLGAARFLRIGTSTDATVVVAVRDVPNPREIGGHLIEALADSAQRTGIEHFVADLRTTNAAMLAMFVGAGFATDLGVGDGTMHMSFSVDPADRRTGRSNVRAMPMWEHPVSA